MLHRLSRWCDRVEEDLDTASAHPVLGPILLLFVAVGSYGALRITIYLVLWTLGEIP